MNDLSEIVIRVRDGDGDAYREIVRRFQDMAVGYAYSLLRDRQLAEDAAQEAFLEAYLCLESLREPAAFPGWFRKIVMKQCDRMTRGVKPQMDTLDRWPEGASSSPNQQRDLERAELRDQVWNAIDTLPAHERSAVLLFHIGGHSQQEVSAFLDVPVTTVKKRLFTARNRLHEILLDTVTDTIRESRPSKDLSFSERVLVMLGAARSGDAERVEALLMNDRRLLTARDWLGNTALIMAVSSGQLAIAGLLRRAGVSPDIHESAAIGDTGRLAELLKDDDTRLDAYSKEGFTALALAAHFGHRESTEYLLNQGANPDLVSAHPLEVTPLHAALYGRRIETALLLLAKGANVNAQRGGKDWPRAGWTALHYAAAYGLVDLIEPFLFAGADARILDDAGRTPLTVAVEEKQTRAAEILSSLAAMP